MRSFWKEKISRREFIKRVLLSGLALGMGWYFLDKLLLRKTGKIVSVFKGAAPRRLWKWSKEAYFYSKLGEAVQCHVCPNTCILFPGDRSFCRVKVNIDGKLYTLVYGNPCAVHVDPIEKKPLFHFLPGSKAFSIATAGCNFRCLNCFPPQTFIITRKGPSRIQDIFFNGKDSKVKLDGGIVKKVEGKQTITHRGNVKKIIHAFCHHYNGELVVIKPLYLPPLKCTPSHEIFVSKNPPDIIKIRAEKIDDSFFLVVPKIKEDGSSQLIDLKGILSLYVGEYKKSRRIKEDDLKRIRELFEKGLSSRKIGEVLGIHPTYVRKLKSKLKKVRNIHELMFGKNEVVVEGEKVRFKTEKRPGIPRFLKLDEKLSRLLGYYCAEGCVHKLKNRPNSYCLIFVFGRKEEEQAKEVAKLIEEIFGIEAHVEYRKSTIAVYTGKASIAIFFKHLCGENALKKKVPYPLFVSPSSVIKEFLGAYIKGDGWCGERCISMNTVSKEMAFGLAYLFLKLGIIPRFYEWEPVEEKEIEGRIIHQSPLYYVRVLRSEFEKNRKNDKIFETEDYFFVPVKKVETEKYEGFVFNLEVENEHSYLANFVAVGNCQNWEISQFRPEDTINFELMPADVVKEALRTGSQSIAYTYSEPVAFYEYMLDTSKLARKAGLRNLWITNGYINEKPLRELCKYLDAANIDLKSFRDEIYNELNAGSLKPVLRTLKILKEEGVWFEVTNLVIPTWTDDLDMIREMCEWLVKNIGPDHPLHFSRFFPHYKLRHLPATPVKILEDARKIAIDCGLKFVYIGNVPGHKARNTYCPSCGRLLIERRGFKILQNNVENGFCKFCGEKIAGVWKA